MAAPIGKRRFPIVGDGGGVSSHVHIEDAAAATALAVERGRPGVYNIVDDDPAPVREWLPGWRARWMPSHRGVYHAGSLGSWPGEAATAMMTEAKGASNEKAKREPGGSRAIRAGGRASRRHSAER